MGKPLENGNVMGINPDWLVVWNMFLCFNILGIITPTASYFPEGLKPPTSHYYKFFVPTIIMNIHYHY